MKKFHLAAALASVCMASPLLAQSSADTDPLVANESSSVYIIKFVEPGLLYNSGQNRAFAPTTPQATGTRKLDARSPAAIQYRDYLKTQQDSYLGQIAAKTGRAVQPTHRYDVTMNGIAAKLSAAEAKQLANIPGIVSVEAEVIYQNYGHSFNA